MSRFFSGNYGAQLGDTRTAANLIAQAGATQGQALANMGKQLGGAISSTLEKFRQNKEKKEKEQRAENQFLKLYEGNPENPIFKNLGIQSTDEAKAVAKDISKDPQLIQQAMNFAQFATTQQREQEASKVRALQMAQIRQNMARQKSADQQANQARMADNQFMQSLMSQTTSPQVQRQADIARPGLPALGNANARNRFMQAQLQQPQNQVPVSNLGSQNFGRFAKEQGLDPTRSVQRMEALRQAELASQPKAPDPQIQIKNENDLRKEFNSLPEVKDFNKVRTSYDKVVLAGENPSAAGDISMIFNYMKILDPGSVVREGEFATAQNAAGVPQRVINQYNKIVKGERLSEAQRSDFMNQARFAAEAQFKPVSEQMTRYQGVARNMGLRLDQVLPVSFLTMGEQLKQKFKTKPDINSDANNITTSQGTYRIPGLSVEAQ